MINKPSDWDTVSAEYGSSFAPSRLPLANYICKIVAATPYVSKKGNQLLRVAWDVAEGDYKDFYYQKFTAEKKDKGKAAKWKSAGTYYLSLGNTGRLKGFAECLEKGNPGYKWDFDDTRLAGLKFAGQMSGENKSYNGYDYMDIRLANVYPVDDFGSMPKAFMRKPSTDSMAPEADNNPFAEGNNTPDEEIPF